MKTFKELMAEAKVYMNDYKIYHSSFTGAVKEVEKYAKSQGYTLDDEEMASEVGTGPAKPGNGKTNKYHLSLYKNGKDQKKKLHFQVYNRGSQIPENFELNLYIN